MEYEIVAVRISNEKTSGITDVRLKNGSFWTLQKVILSIKLGDQFFYTTSASTKAFVDVVDDNPPYIRTRGNETTSDNLLELPRF